MKVTLSIDDEVQLKKDIKNMVDGFIKSYSREQADKLIQQEISRVVAGQVDSINKSYNTIERKFNETIKSVVDKILLGDNWIKHKEVIAIVEKQVKELLPDIMHRKVDPDIGKIVEQARKDFIAEMQKMLDK